MPSSLAVNCMYGQECMTRSTQLPAHSIVHFAVMTSQAVVVV